MRLSRLLARAVRDAIFPHRSDIAAELRRYKIHLDDIRCDLANAGVPVPTDDDPETTPRRMVQDLIEERTALALEYAHIRDALAPVEQAARPHIPTRPRPEVPAERRRAILRIVNNAADPATADYIADRQSVTTCSTARRLISDLAADGYLTHDGKRPRAYRLTDKGAADIAGDAPVADTEATDAAWRVVLRNCDSCKHDEGDRCTAMNVHIYKWSNKNTGASGRPKPGADNCPGHEARP